MLIPFGVLKNKVSADRHTKEIIKGSLVSFLLKMVGMLLGYAVVLIISREYGAVGTGMYSIHLSILTFVGTVSVMGMGVSILRFVGQFNKAGEKGKLRLLFRHAVEVATPLSIVLGCLLYFLSEPVAIKLFNNISYTTSLQYAAFIVPFMALNIVSMEYLRGLKLLSISEFLRSISRPLINVILLLTLGLFIVDDLLPVYTLGLGIVASAVIALLFIKKYTENLYDVERSEFTKKELVLTSIPMLISTVASLLMNDAVTILLEIYSTTHAVGIFSAAVKLSLLVGLVLTVVNTISAPKFSELFWANETSQLQNTLTLTSKINLFFSSITALLLILFSDKVLLLFGEDFVEGKTALLILIAGQWINAVTGSAGVILNMTGHQMLAQKILLVSLTVTVMACFALIPTYGILGASIAVLCGTFTLRVSNVFYVKKILNLRTIPTILPE